MLFGTLSEFLDEKQNVELDDPRWIRTVGLILGAMFGLLSAFFGLAGWYPFSEFVPIGLICTLLVGGCFALVVTSEYSETSIFTAALAGAFGWITGFFPPIMLGWAYLHGSKTVWIAIFLSTSVIIGLIDHRRIHDDKPHLEA